MKKLHSISIVVLFMILYVTPCFAVMENEFPGFRGIKWNDSPSQYKDVLYETKDSLSIELAKEHAPPEYKIYEQKNENLYFGLAKLQSVLYYFDKLGLAKVEIRCEKLEDTSEFVNECYRNWGKDYGIHIRTTATNVTTGYSYFWEGDETDAHLICFVDLPATLILRVKDIWDRE